MSKKGFTLIELLIVIAILGILVALILPRFSDVREDANKKVCIANLRGLVSAMNTYEVQYNVDKAWGTDVGFATIADLVVLNLLANAVDCPDPDSTGYTLGVDGDGDPTAECSLKVSKGHVWPEL